MAPLHSSFGSDGWHLPFADSVGGFEPRLQGRVNEFEASIEQPLCLKVFLTPLEPYNMSCGEDIAFSHGNLFPTISCKPMPWQLKLLVLSHLTSSQASVRTIYAVIGRYRNVQEQVYAARGITYASVLRRSPNCFHLWRQAEVLKRAGCGTANQSMLDTLHCFGLILISSYYVRDS